MKCKKWNFGNDILNADIAVIVVENGLLAMLTILPLFR